MYVIVKNMRMFPRVLIASDGIESLYILFKMYVETMIRPVPDIPAIITKEGA